MTHPLDHLVMPTRALPTARARLGALGFTVAPQGTHPFGTVNCCVYLADGTFLEPLAIDDAVAAKRAADEGNVFVGRDRAFRTRNGDEGFSAVVFGSEDAGADHARYEAAGLSAGPRLDFSRPITDAHGNSDKASFRLAFAADSANPDAFVFACERANMPKIDRAPLQTHANGALGINEIVGVSTVPADAVSLLAVAAALAGGKQDTDMLVLPNAALRVVTPSAFQERFGVEAVASALRFSAVVLAVGDAALVKSVLAGAGVVHHLLDGQIVVPPAAGQGATFVFVEKS